MNHSAVAQAMGLALLVLATSMGLPAVIAIVQQDVAQLQAFGVSSGLCAVMAGALLLLSRRPPAATTARDGLAVALLCLILLPVPSAIPFVFGTAEPSFLAAYHEAVSCLTTTGHSVIDVGDAGWPVSLIAWRGMLHFLGAVATLTVTVSVFAAMNLGGPGIHRTVLFTISEEGFFKVMPRVMLTLSSLLGALIAVCFMTLLIGGADIERAVWDAVSIGTTGLVSPTATEDIPHGLLGGAVAWVGLAFAASGIAVLMDVRPWKGTRLLRDPEALLLAILVPAIAVLAMIAGLSALPAAGWAASSLATSGLTVFMPSAEIVARLPLPLLIFPALIGGSALSTAGGIKLARIFILSRRAIQEFAKLGYRNSVVKLTYRGRLLNERTVLGIWVYLVAYIAAITVIFCAFSFFGDDFSTALQTAIGGISNSGWLVPERDALAPWRQLTLILAMMLGRLEVLALVPALRLEFWRF